MNEQDSAAVALETRQRMEGVWRERAQRLSRRPNLDRAAQDAVPVVVLGIGKERFGIDLGDVAEVFPPVEPTPVPGAAPVFSGVINVHGEIRPVLSLRRLLAMPASGEKPGKGNPARVILLRKEGREVGLQIDSVEQIRWIGSGDMQVREDGNAPASPHTSAHVKGSTRDLLMLLSTEALLAEVDTSGLDKGVTN